MEGRPRRSSISETAKGIGCWILGFGFLAVLIAIGTAFIYGVVWISAKLYPIVEVLSVLGFIVLVLNLLPSAIFKGSRRICGNGIVIVSYVWGVSLWMYSILILYQLWGVGGIYLGFATLGVVTVPLACVASLFRGEWSLTGQLILWAVIVFATRALGYWIISKGEMSVPDFSDWPPAPGEIGSGTELLIGTRKQKDEAQAIALRAEEGLATGCSAPVSQGLLDLSQPIDESTITDSLTGLYNARHFGFMLETEIYRSQRYGYDFSLVFFDIEGFDKVADSFGDQVGTKLLAEVGDKVKSFCRLIDFAFRYGSNEFVALLPQTSKENACIWARRLHQLMRDTTWLQSEGLNVRLTARLGVASYPADSDTKVELLHLADEALSLVKNSTRDGVAAANLGILPGV